MGQPTLPQLPMAHIPIPYAGKYATFNVIDGEFGIEEAPLLPEHLGITSPEKPEPNTYYGPDRPIPDARNTSHYYDLETTKPLQEFRTEPVERGRSWDPGT